MIVTIKFEADDLKPRSTGRTAGDTHLIRFGELGELSVHAFVTAAQAFAIHEAWGLLADELAARESEVAA